MCDIRPGYHARAPESAITPDHAAAPLTGPPGSVRAGAIIAAHAAGGVLVSLAQTLIIPLINELPRIFDTSAANASWIITATLLAGAVSTPITGRLADMYGKKRMLQISLALFTAGSLLAAAATSTGIMITGRSLQGVASGLIPLGISLLHDYLPRDQAGRAIALMSASMGIGGSLGLPLAAAVAQYASWRWLFGAVAVIAFGVGIALQRSIPKDTAGRSGARFDIVGALGLSTGLIALLLTISKGNDWAGPTPSPSSVEPVHSSCSGCGPSTRVTAPTRW